MKREFAEVDGQEDPGSDYPVKPSSRSSSCLLCRKRKIKCDHRLPSCSTCIKAGIQCIQPENYIAKVPEKDQYTLLLEKKIKFLEKFIDKEEFKKNRSLKNYKKLSPFIDSNSDSINEHEVNSVENDINISESLSNSIQNLQNGDSNEQEKSYINSNRTVEEEVILKLENIDTERCLFAPYNLSDFLSYDPVFEIDDNLSKIFLETYFSRLQFKFPILDEKEVLEFHNAVATKNLYPYMTDSNHFHFSWCRMFLIFAISSSIHLTTGKYTGPQPARFFASAMRHSINISNISTMNQIEILFLSVLYLIRTDKDSVVLYDMMKDCMKLVEELNLHKSSSYKDVGHNLKDKQMRIFWCVYLLERVIAISVSKPYSLTESSIDIDIPLFEYEPSEAVHPNGITFINQSIKIRRIESLLVEDLNIIENLSNGKASREQLPLVEKFFKRLEIWRADCEGFSRDIEYETLRLYYYRSIRLLIQPYLELLDPEDRLFKECQAAAGQICRLFKVFHQKTVSGHSTLAIHTVFVAGVTLIYCLWLARNKEDMKYKALDGYKYPRPIVTESLFSGLDDLRACSICLYVMAERSKFALSFRDTFDQLMNATIGNLILRCGATPGEILYNSSPGMPPAVVRGINIPQNRTQSQEPEPLPTEDQMEEEERKREQLKLQKKAVPQSLSYLLINSPPLKPLDSANDSFSSNNMLPPIPNSNLNHRINYTAPTFQDNIYSEQIFNTKETNSMTTKLPWKYDFVPFNNQTHNMINNISNWTEDCGQQPIINGYGIDNNGNASNMNLSMFQTPIPNQMFINKENGDSKLFQSEEFCWVNDDYGFLA